MPVDSSHRLAIACSSGGFKGVFAHGVLTALEEAGIYAEAYAGASSSVFPCMSAVLKQAGEVGLRYWYLSLDTLSQPGKGMSDVVLRNIAESTLVFFEPLFQPGNARLYIATSTVLTKEAAALTQGDGARSLGRRLLIAAARKDRNWADQHLALHLFDTASPDPTVLLNRQNIAEVIYASTRMLHAWAVPAWIEGRAYIDASYSCMCPAIEIAQPGYEEVIAIANEPGPLYHDMFQTELIPDNWEGIPIHIIKPDIDPARLGSDFTEASREGMLAAYEHGIEKGREFLSRR